MRLFFAGAIHASVQPRHYATGLRRKLISYAGVNNWEKASVDFWIYNHPNDSDVFLDSGAFSAFSLGTVIDIDAYCEFIQQYAHQIHCYAALDVVGGNWQASERNLQIMLRRGLTPLPVYHHQDPWPLLPRMLEQHKHMALGGMVGSGASRADLQTYLDRCFSVIGKYWPIKVHGFGILAQWALERYPFYSVDSSSAIVSAAMGQVSTFDHGHVESHSWREYARRTRDGEIMDNVAEERAKGGSAYIGRQAQNIRTQLTLERHVTQLWARRGVTW